MHFNWRRVGIHRHDVVGQIAVYRSAILWIALNAIFDGRRPNAAVEN
jgi:hypothetical protein